MSGFPGCTVRPAKSAAARMTAGRWSPATMPSPANSSSDSTASGAHRLRQGRGRTVLARRQVLRLLRLLARPQLPVLLYFCRSKSRPSIDDTTWASRLRAAQSRDANRGRAKRHGRSADLLCVGGGGVQKGRQAHPSDAPAWWLPSLRSPATYDWLTCQVTSCRSASWWSTKPGPSCPTAEPGPAWLGPRQACWLGSWA
jgi:hypothetical protein